MRRLFDAYQGAPLTSAGESPTFAAVLACASLTAGQSTTTTDSQPTHKTRIGPLPANRQRPAEQKPPAASAKAPEKKSAGFNQDGSYESRRPKQFRQRRAVLKIGYREVGEARSQAQHEIGGNQVGDGEIGRASGPAHARAPLHAALRSPAAANAGSLSRDPAGACRQGLFPWRRGWRVGNRFHGRSQALPDRSESGCRREDWFALADRAGLGTASGKCCGRTGSACVPGSDGRAICSASGGSPVPPLRPPPFRKRMGPRRRSRNLTTSRSTVTPRAPTPPWSSFGGRLSYRPIELRMLQISAG